MLRLGEVKDSHTTKFTPLYVLQNPLRISLNRQNVKKREEMIPDPFFS